jgi:spore coat polysaccharide biosynthesis protein SpsF
MINRKYMHKESNQNLNIFVEPLLELNVLKRIYLATTRVKENCIIQLTADNPLIDPKIIDYVVKFFIKEYPKYDFVTNNNLFDKKKKSFPIGMNVSVFKKESLKKIYKIAKKKDLLEHPTLYFYREGKKEFNCYNIEPPKKWHNKVKTRLTMDTLSDYIFLKKIYYSLKKNNHSSLEKIFLYLQNNKKIVSINKNIKQKIPKGLS